MSTSPLDLTIALTPPPPGAPEETLAAISLSCAELSHAGDLLRDPLTKAERAELAWYLEEYWRWPYEQFAERARRVEALLEELGRRLYDALFGSLAARDLVQEWRRAEAEQRRISVVSGLPRALSLPWELLRDGQGFLVQRTRSPVSLVRRLPQQQRGEMTGFAPPLRVLLVTARPEGTGFVDPRGIARELVDEVEPLVAAGTLELELLRPPTLDALRRRLRDAARPVHVLHFDGHGVFQPEGADPPYPADGHTLRGGGSGMLAFEKADGSLDLVPAAQLGTLLQDSGVSLAVLTACQSALSAEDSAFSSVAGRLIESGVPGVVAMSASVLVASAARYVEAFYAAMAAGRPVPLAHEQARQALHDNPERHVHRRSDDQPGAPVRLVDWWLPHYYQQRELTLAPSASATPAARAPEAERLSEEMPPPPRYGWSGRARELLQVERWLLQGKLVAVRGFGGQGKTALAREAADWLTRTGLYAGAVFVAYEHGGGAEQLLAALARFLGVYDDQFRPDELRAAMAALRPALRRRFALVIADNLESVLPRGEAALPAAERRALWDALLALREAGAGVLLTTRDVSFGDGRMAPGRHVAHLQLGGLGEEDAYALASRLLEDLQIARARAPYDELRALLRRLDHHPLAIQLVLPALAELTPVEVGRGFSALLPRFKDDEESGRNASLLASLDYSLRRLTEAQRALLPRLAVFEGGAWEFQLLQVTELPEAEWAELRQALEQAALLRAEPLEGWKVPFLQFHPVLTPYLRTLPGAEDEGLALRFREGYAALANDLYSEDNRNPHTVRLLVRRELPNLRRALDVLVTAGAADAAVDMADSIAKFLADFGLRRELDELRRKVTAVVNAQSGDGGLTQAEYLRESGLGEGELARGNLQAAYSRFASLLAKHTALPNGAPRGSGSYEHNVTLTRLARCLAAGGQPAAAEQALREALRNVEALLAAHPENTGILRHRGALLTDLGDVLRTQGSFPEARAAYEAAVEVDKQLGDVRGQGVDLGQLGGLALQQRDYPEAARRYRETLVLFQRLGEPASEAVGWHQLGMVAQEQRQWDEAGRCYRESLSLKEQLGDAAGIARTCNQLAIVAQLAGRPAEAEGWYRRALELDEHLGNQSAIARDCNNLAGLLLAEVRAGRAAPARLAEACALAERALALKETLDASSEIWTTLYTLAGIAEQEGRAEEAGALRRRERESFAAFAGNRWHIDWQHGELIAAIVAAARGDAQAREAVEAALPQLESNGWKITDATRRLWAGERDWHTLSEGIDSNSALLVLRALEELG